MTVQFSNINVMDAATIASEKGWTVLGVLSGVTTQFVMVERVGTHSTRFAPLEWTGEVFVGGHYDMTRNRAFNDLVHRAKGA